MIIASAPLCETRLLAVRMLWYNTVPDVVPVFDEFFKICADGTSVLPVQVHQVEVVGIVDSL